MNPRRYLALAFALGLGCHEGGPTEPSIPATGEPGATDSVASAEETSDVKIRLIFADRTLTSTLEKSRAARDFVALLPLELTLRDYAGTEKVSDLPSRLSTEGSPSGVDPAPGDIAYYAPWGNLALFYRDFGFSTGLVRLGRLDSGVDHLASMRGDFRVRIERAP